MRFIWSKYDGNMTNFRHINISYFFHISEIWGAIWSSIWRKWTNIMLWRQSQRENMTLFFVIFFWNLIFSVIFFHIFSWIWKSYLIWSSYLDQMKRTPVRLVNKKCFPELYSKLVTYATKTASTRNGHFWSFFQCACVLK